MYIAFVTPEFLKNGKLYPGGLATYTYNVATELIRSGHSVRVFFIGENSADYLFEEIHVTECKNISFRLRKMLKLFFLNKLNSSIDRLTGSMVISRAVYVHRERKKIDIFHYTNWQAIAYSKVCSPSVLRISSFEPLWNNNPDVKTADKALCAKIEAVSIRKFENIIGPGDYLSRIIERNLGLKTTIKYFPTPVPERKEYEFVDKAVSLVRKKVVIYVGTLSYLKGSALLFDIIEHYLSNFNDTRFVVVGKAGKIGERHANDYLSRLMDVFGGQFEYHANLDRNELTALMTSARLMLIPSVIDNFPNTALESMMCGTPVLASATSSLDGLIQNNWNGFLMEDRESGRWISRIRDILSLSEETYAEIQQNIQVSLTEHKPSNAVSKLVGFYGEVIERAKSKRLSR